MSRTTLGLLYATISFVCIPESVHHFPVKGEEGDASESHTGQSVEPAPSIRVEHYQPMPLQQPFQPGSTPTHLSSRFMVHCLSFILFEIKLKICPYFFREEEHFMDIIQLLSSIERQRVNRCYDAFVLLYQKDIFKIKGLYISYRV